MYSDWVVIATVAVAAVFIWLLTLSFLVWKQSNFLKLLFPRSGERDIRKKFEEVLGRVRNFESQLSDLDTKITEYQKREQRHIQRVELLRFNPYNDTGGDQSFAAAFLDNGGSGIVLTSLHARSGTRVFAKDIVLGKSNKYQLSKEEESLIKRALTKTSV